MDLSNYLLMKQEISLLVIFLIVVIYDLFFANPEKTNYQPLVCCLFLVHTVLGFIWQFSDREADSSFAGMYVAGNVEYAVKNILNIGVLILFLQTKGWLCTEENKLKRGEFYMLTLSTLFGMYLMISAENFLLFFIGLEIASLPMAALVAFDKYIHHSAEAGAKYVFTSVFSSAIMLFGLSMLYGSCGTFYFVDINITEATPLLIMAMVFICAGLFFKISLVPFHFWTADVYEGAPTNITAYLSTISKGAAVYALMIILYKVFAPMVSQWHEVLWWLILLSITVGNLFAMRQKNIKRFLAFSSVSQAGYIILSVISGTETGMASTIYYILVYIVTNMAAFGVVSVIENRTGKVMIRDYDGLYKTNPMLALIMMIAMFSLGGIPPTAGFFSKFFTFVAAAEQKEYLLLFLALINTVISLYYYLVVVKAMFINKNNSPIEKLETDIYMKLSFAVCMIGIFAIGFAGNIYQYMIEVSFGM